MSFGAASSAIPSRLGPPVATLTGVLPTLSRMFEKTRPESRSDLAYLWWLMLLIGAGAGIRFWGLGDVGLHGDEETMAMAVQHILVDGRPILPSGMFYPRGMTQLYLMALSVSVFGETEWALRLPSVLCGIALIPLSYLMGKRFLRPQWCLALAAAVAFLPDLIVYSQTARMYIFLVAAVAGAMVCIFEWERSARVGWLLAAIAILIIGIDMQLLAVATVLIFLLPGLLNGNLRTFAYGVAAAAAVTVGFLTIDSLTSAQYPVPPPEFAADLGVSSAQDRMWGLHEFSLPMLTALSVAGLAVVVLAVQLVTTMAVRGAAWVSASLFIVGIGLQLALFYHLAVLAYVAGAGLAIRYGGAKALTRVGLIAAVVAVIAGVHAGMLWSMVDTPVQLVGALVGQPSVWPYVRVAQLSEAAGLLSGLLLGWGVYRFMCNRSIADYWLLAVLGIFFPVFALGLFAWNVPPRYTAMSLPPLLLCAFALAQRGSDWLFAKLSAARARGGMQIVAPALVAVCVINPPAAAAVTNAGYRLYPDHNGAAEFIRTLPVNDDDVLLAEDVLQQTYYLGKVDYWLIGPMVGKHFIKSVDGGVVDFYTGTPVVVSAAMLDQVLLENQGRNVYVIGSGEGQRNNRLYARGEDLHAAIESERLEVIYTGRDGLTRVWRAVPGVVGTSKQAESADSHPEAAADALPPDDAGDRLTNDAEVLDSVPGHSE